MNTLSEQNEMISSEPNSKSTSGLLGSTLVIPEDKSAISAIVNELKGDAEDLYNDNLENDDRKKNSNSQNITETNCENSNGEDISKEMINNDNRQDSSMLQDVTIYAKTEMNSLLYAQNTNSTQINEQEDKNQSMKTDPKEILHGMILENKELQRDVINLIAHKKDKIADEYVVLLSDLEMKKRYSRVLPDIEERIQEINSNKQKSNSLTAKLGSRLNEKDEKANEICKAFNKFKIELVVSCSESGNGKISSMKQIEELTNIERETQEKLGEERLKHIYLRSCVKKIEGRIQKKNKFADGLSLIDYEQLQLENKKLHKKLDESLQGILLINKKLEISSKQIANSNEKLATLLEIHEKKSESLKEVDLALYENRNVLSELKLKLVKIKKENDKLKDENHMTKNESIMKDFKKTKMELETMYLYLSNLKLFHGELVKA